MNKKTVEKIYEEELAQDHYEHHENVTANAMANHFIASQGILRAKLRMYEWYVKGPNAYSLRQIFDNLLKENDEFTEKIASVMLADGAKPYALTEKYVEFSFVKENGPDKYETAENMVENIVEDFRLLRTVASRAAELAQKEDYQELQYVLIEYKTALKKDIFELQAFLGQDPLEDEKDEE